MRCRGRLWQNYNVQGQSTAASRVTWSQRITIGDPTAVPARLWSVFPDEIVQCERAAFSAYCARSNPADCCA
jgi:hypothetical protein